MRHGRSDLRWGVEQRLGFIEFRLFWEGHVNRRDLMDQFGVSVNQATTDLSRYLGLAPDNMVYDKSVRAYVRGPGFEPRFGDLDAGRYLSQLRSVADGTLDREDSWIADLPPHASAPTPVRGVDPVTLRSMVGAIRRSEAMEVKYQFLSGPEPRWRWIAPHAIAFDGFRWHTRAFCLTDECFKDFLLSRILDVRGSRESGTSADNDREWHAEVLIVFGPHPGLSPGHRAGIELDYGMSGGKATMKVRRSLVAYALRRLGLDADPSTRPPSDQQIVLIETRETAT